MLLSKRAQGISPSPTLAINSKAKKLEAEGKKIISFGAGEPDFDTPSNIKQKAIDSINKGFTKYTAASGIDSLKDAIIAKLKRDNSVEYNRSEVIISCGAKHSLFNISMVLFDEGDEVILPAPYWVTYPEQIKFAGAVPVIIQTREEDGFKVDIDLLNKMVNKKTKAMILNSPSNPTGAVYDKEDLYKIAQCALDNKLFVVSDECYEKMTYDGKKHISIASLGEEIKKKTVVVNAVSKSYSMTGWRIGYAAGDAEIVKTMANLQSHCTSNPTSISQQAAVEALNGPQDIIQEMIVKFKERRDYIVDFLNKINRINCFSPQGAFYAFPNISKLKGTRHNNRMINSSMDLAMYLLEEAEIAVVPGNDFGDDNYIRLSFACSIENIKKGMERMKEAVERLQ